jgi:DNA-binding response OmpR family regulator
MPESASGRSRIDSGSAAGRRFGTLSEGADVGSGPILVVDDDDVLATLISETLELVGYRTTRVGSYQEAVAAAHEQTPGLAIIDIALPGRSGYEVFEELRNTFGPDLPVIFISGQRTETFDRVAGLLAGGDDYLVKPFDPDELVASVQARLRRAAPA